MTKELIHKFLQLCETWDLKYELDTDGFYIPSNHWHTCAFINMIDEDEQNWVRLVVQFEGGHYRCDVERVEDLESKFCYWIKGDEMEKESLEKWCTMSYHVDDKPY